MFEIYPVFGRKPGTVIKNTVRKGETDMLKMRIQILKNGGVIGEDVADFMIKVIDMMAADYPQVGMDPAAMFTTHLAMALERIKKGEIVDALDEEIFAEVLETPEYPQAVEFRDKMLSFCPLQFPASEAQFILMHICNMLAAQ